MCAITSSSAWSGIKMCLAQQNSDGEESHDGLTDEKSTQIAADAVDGEGKQHKEDADAAGNQIQHESDARVAEPVQNTAQRHAEVQERTDPAERPYKCSGERVPNAYIPDKVTGMATAVQKKPHRRQTRMVFKTARRMSASFPPALASRDGEHKNTETELVMTDGKHDDGHRHAGCKDAVDAKRLQAV